MDVKLPPQTERQPSVSSHACLEASGHCDFPIPNLIQTEFNVNAGHGGGSALMLLTRVRLFEDEEGKDSNATELNLLRCGFDGNHFESTPVMQAGEHGRYNWYEILTNADGYVQPKLVFGKSHATVLSNMARFGHCGCGVLFEGPKEGTPICTEISCNFAPVGTCLLAICSAKDEELRMVHSQSYLIHLTLENEVEQFPLISSGADKWKFQAVDEKLQIQGPAGTHCTIFHNNSAAFLKDHPPQKMGKVFHTQAFDGTKPTTLVKDAWEQMGRAMLLLCSNSFGNEDMTTSALYHVTLKKGDGYATFIKGTSVGANSSDVWKVEIGRDDSLVVTGPPGPCRYAIFSNIPEDINDPKERCLQDSCLATGNATPVQGGLLADNDVITVWIDRVTKILLSLNGSTIQEIKGNELMKQPDGRLAFQRRLNDSEKNPGLKMFRAFAVMPDQNGSDVSIELGGSPCHVIKQTPGVTFAVNLGGPVYEALNHVVFRDSQMFFKLEGEKGLQCFRKFWETIPLETRLHALVAKTFDGFLYSSCNSSHPSFADNMTFEIPIPEGQYTLRMYALSNGLDDAEIEINDVEVTEKVLKALKKIPDEVEGLTAKTCELPLIVDESGKATISITGTELEVEAVVEAFLIYDKSFKEPRPSQEEKMAEAKVKQELADKLNALDRTFSMKEMKIAGWSPNLLENASGETGDMAHWNYGGDWKVQDGGHETEKSFATSYMTCYKEQEVDLTQHFSEKHLDSGPEIQVSESFREGCSGGGYYSLTASLLNSDGDVIETKEIDKTLEIIELPEWTRETITFKDYKPGVRIVSIRTTGQDDKFWAGYFGTRISAASIRVKTEIHAASDDKYSDVDFETADKCKQQIAQFIRELQEKYKEDLQKLVREEEEECFSPTVKEDTAERAPKPQKISTKPRRVKREIRIFVSSTFRDFGEEREVIIKKVFRELNRVCLDRGVFFTYVDLRWGITEDQTKGGETISICLREIDKCRPYFICLLGDRYGWSQTEKKPDQLLDKSYSYASANFPVLQWVDKYRFNTSVTKLEVLYAALLKKDARKDRIFFYLREPRTTREELPPPVSENDKEPPKGETQWHFDQQQKLRNDVAKSDFDVKTFKVAVDAAGMIKEDLMKCIDADFPPGTNLTVLQREQEAHIAFAEARRRVYIGGADYFKRIDDYFAGEHTEPLAILGESGSGKSALVANWCGRFETNNPETFLFMHFIGSSAQSASHLGLLRRLYEEMKQHFDLDMEVPSSDRNLVIDLPSWLKIVGKRSKVMLVLDALNQLDSGAAGKGDEKDLKWLPKELPPNVSMLVSTLPGEALDAVTAAGWPTIKVEPLREDQKREIITGYMDLYSKTLNEEQTTLIIDAKQSRNPLYLKALLDEVRVYGEFFQLTMAIKSYLTAEDPGKLFMKILERLENDFEKGAVSRPHLVRDTTMAIWCSNRGMSEQELLAFLKVPSLVWSPFYLSLEENLVNRNGIVNFFHDHLRQAVEGKYLPTPEEKKRGYLELANFFSSQEIDDRYVDEVPHLLSEAGELERLRAAVLEIQVFKRMMETEEGKFDLIRAWILLGGFEQVDDAYLEVLSRSDEWDKSVDKVEIIKLMAGFFMQLGLLEGARVLYERLLKELEQRYIESHCTIVQHHFQHCIKRRCNHPDVIDVLIELGNVCQKQGDLEAAGTHLEEALTRLTRVRTPHDKLKLVKALLGIGSVKRLQTQADVAKKLLQRALEVARQVLGQDHHYTAAIVGQLGELCYDQSRLVEALVYYTWDLQQTQKDTGLDHPRIAAIMNNIGLVQDDMHEKTAEKTFKMVLGILLEAYGKDHVDVATVRYNLGAQFFANNLYERSKYQFDEAYRVFGLFLGEDHQSTKEALKASKMVEECRSAASS